MIRSSVALNLEEKVTYTQQTGSVDYTATGTVFDLTAGLARGDGAIDNFTGDIIRPTRLLMKCCWSTNQVFSSLRLLIFQWEDASVPVGAGIFAFIGSTLAPFSPLLWTNVPKIHVLYDELTTIFPSPPGGYAATNLIINITKMRPIYFASGSTIMQKNGLYAVAISDDGLVVYPVLDFISELLFTDA